MPHSKAVKPVIYTANRDRRLEPARLAAAFARKPIQEKVLHPSEVPSVLRKANTDLPFCVSSGAILPGVKGCLYTVARQRSLLDDSDPRDVLEIALIVEKVDAAFAHLSHIPDDDAWREKRPIAEKILTDDLPPILEELDKSPALPKKLNMSSLAIAALVQELIHKLGCFDKTAFANLYPNLYHVWQGVESERSVENYRQKEAKLKAFAFSEPSGFQSLNPCNPCHAV